MDIRQHDFGGRPAATLNAAIFRLIPSAVTRMALWLALIAGPSIHVPPCLAVQETQQPLSPRAEQFIRGVEDLRARNDLFNRHRQLIDARLVLEPLFIVRLDEWLRMQLQPFNNSILTTDRRIYRMLEDQAVAERLFGKGNVPKELTDRSTGLSKRWERDLMKFLENGDVELIDRFEQDCLEYHAWLDGQLDDHQKAQLGRMAILRDLMAGGFSAQTVKRLLPDGIQWPEAAQQALDARIADLRKKQAAGINEILLGVAGELLPGWLEGLEASPGELPPLPVGVFCRLASDPDRCRTGWQKYSSGLVDVEPASGNWLFPSPTLWLKPGGAVTWQYAYPNGHASSFLRLARRYSPLELTREQLDGWYALNGFSAGSVLPTAGDDGQRREERMRLAAEGKLRAHDIDVERRRTEKLEQLLLPEQLAGIRAVVRLHALFTLGPHVIHDQRGGGDRLSDSEFERRLQGGLERLKGELAGALVECANLFRDAELVPAEQGSRIADAVAELPPEGADFLVCEPAPPPGQEGMR